MKLTYEMSISKTRKVMSKILIKRPGILLLLVVIFFSFSASIYCFIVESLGYVEYIRRGINAITLFLYQLQYLLVLLAIICLKKYEEKEQQTLHWNMSLIPIV